MRVVIAGAGNVGSSLAEQMVNDGADVVLIEKDGEAVERASYEMDLLAVQGNAGSAEVLSKARVGESDLFVAATGVSELNVMACTYVESVADVETIARVHEAEYIDMWRDNPGVFGVDHMLYPERMAAERVAGILQFPEAVDVGSFAGGAIRMVEFHAVDGVAEREIRGLDLPGDLLIASVVREGEMLVPTGETVLEEGDRIVVVGSTPAVKKFGYGLCEGDSSFDRVGIVGSGEVATNLVGLLQDRGVDVEILESVEERARELAEAFPEALVLQGEGTDLELLRSEKMGEVDAFVSATDSDEKNLMASLLGKRLGVDECVAKVEDPEYVELFETMGVDSAVNPHRVTAERILRLMRGSSLRSLVVLEGGRAEVMELVVAEGSKLEGERLEESGLPEGAIVGAVMRNGDVMIPTGETVLEAGDDIVVIAESEVVPETEAAFH